MENAKKKDSRNTDGVVRVAQRLDGLRKQVKEVRIDQYL